MKHDIEITHNKRPQMRALVCIDGQNSPAYYQP